MFLGSIKWEPWSEMGRVTLIYLYCRGRDRFSKVSSSDKIFLQSVEKLNKENVLHISVGAYHCIALTQSYNVFCWGGLGGKEEDESLIREPVLLKAVSEVGVNNIVAGPHQVSSRYVNENIGSDLFIWYFDILGIEK